MAYTDAKGTTIAAGDTLAAALRVKNRAVLAIGVIAGPYTNEGETYFEIAKTIPGAQGTWDRGRVHLTMSGAGAGKAEGAVKSGFSA